MNRQDKRVLVRGKRKCKDSEAGACQQARKNEEDNVTGAKIRQEGQVANDVREVMAYLVGGYRDFAFSEWDGEP